MIARIPRFEYGDATIGDVRLNYALGGDRSGPPVLLWHGFLGTHYVWRKLAPMLAGRGYAVLAPDMRGYGDSAKPDGDGYDGVTLARDFRSLVADLGFSGGQPITIVAHDMGAPPALLWAAHYPDEVRGLIYLDEPVLLPDVIAKAISYTPATTKMGGLWWWAMALAPDLVESLIVGNEAAFLGWFYDHYAADGSAIEPQAKAEYLRTFTGRENVLGAFGVYRGVPKTIEQTASLANVKLTAPVVALGGEQSIGDQARQMMMLVAETVAGGAVEGCGHFIPEEKPDELMGWIETLSRGRSSAST